MESYAEEEFHGLAIHDSWRGLNLLFEHNVDSHFGWNKYIHEARNDSEVAGMSSGSTSLPNLPLYASKMYIIYGFVEYL